MRGAGTVLLVVASTLLACERPPSEGGAPSTPSRPVAPSLDAPEREPAASELEPATALRIIAPSSVTIPERESWSLKVELDGASASADVRVWARGLPPGARWNEDERTVEFRPDFIQGGSTWTVELLARAGGERAEHAIDISVVDSIAPPWPKIEQEQRGQGFTRLLVSQRTDDFLEAPSSAGRTFEAVVIRPDPGDQGQRFPVVVLLHGLLVPPHRRGATDRFIISPADPHSTYWWGHRARIDREEQVPPHTQRRVLHLLEWVLRHEPTADPDRVFIAGRSMGGAGAATIGLLHARHFAGIDARLWQAIPVNHRPIRMTQLSGLWGRPEDGLRDGEPEGMSAWTRMDLTRVLLQEPEAREQWLFSRHGKDDAVIHFGAAVLPSPETRASLYEVLQRTRSGHHVVWDEGGHQHADPLLGERWWSEDWDPVVDEVTGLRRDRAFVAFSGASHDDDPGDGGNGRHPWDPERGYAGVVERAGDTGWSGDRSGGLNRYLRWDAREIVDRVERFEVPLRALPLHEGPWPITVDVTPRRVQAFGCRAGETVSWSFGARHGEAIAGPDGELTIVALPLTSQWQTLRIVRKG